MSNKRLLIVFLLFEAEARSCNVADLIADLTRRKYPGAKQCGAIQKEHTR